MTDLIDTGYAFALLLAVFLPLELLFPADHLPTRRLLRPEFGTDLLFFLGQYMLWNAPVVAALVWIHQNSGGHVLDGIQEQIAGLPFWTQTLLVILVSDACIYWGHRLSHSVPLLWRFHRVHHTSERVDWLAAHREHPVDNLYTRTIENLPLILLGFPIEALAGFAMFRGLWAIFIHSNTAISPGPLRFLIGSPRLHHWHHELGHSGRVNFANLSPLMDLLFGTFHDPGHMPERYGIPDRIPHGWSAQMLEPFRRRRQGLTTR
jgi:sterol desaturase/sphingolipid hydroxylase (fatty acid hydroxylase superfamily)